MRLPVLNQALPDWLGHHQIQIRQLPDWSGGCLIEIRHCLIDQAAARLKSGSWSMRTPVCEKSSHICTTVPTCYPGEMLPSSWILKNTKALPTLSYCHPIKPPQNERTWQNEFPGFLVRASQRWHQDGLANSTTVPGVSWSLPQVEGGTDENPDGNPCDYC